MYLDIASIDTELKDVSFRYEFYKGETKVKEGNFTDTYLNSNTTTTDYTLYIWIDGANPNNYIYFNCATYPSTNCELWRIIGVFDGKLKIIRNESIGDIPYDNDDEDTYLKSLSSSNTNQNSDSLEYNEKGYKIIPIAGDITSCSYVGQNDYSKSTLQKILNNYYYNSTKYSGSKSYDFTSNGLKNDATRNMIVNTLWSLGGWNSVLIYSDQIYNYERGTMVYSGNSTIWTGKIALMYPSDYGYAADLNKCTQNFF